MIEFQLRIASRRFNTRRIVGRRVISLLAGIGAIGFACGAVCGADLTFNITYIAESQPIAPAPGSTFFYGDVWSENGFVYVGSDRGVPRSGHVSNGQAGISVFSLSNSGIPTYLPPPTSPPAGFQPTTYFGNEMEDVEVYDGIGYFASDYNPSNASLRTGVDIVDLSIPFDPIMLGQIDETDCLAGNPSVCAHGKAHTVSIQRFNEGTLSEQRFMYTADNETDVVKISNVSDPQNPFLLASVDLGLPSNVASHEVMVRDDRLYVASKVCPGCSGSGNGWFHIYDVSNPASPVLMKAFLSGEGTHTAMPSYDGETLVVTEERSNGNVKIYDISMIDQPNDPHSPILLTTLNRTIVGLDAHSPHHPHIHGNLLFLTWYEAGLTVFNIADPAHPVLVGAFDTWPGTSNNYNGTWGVDLSHGLRRTLISDRTRGLIVVDASGVVAAGDFNQDMVVDEDDYALWFSTFGTTRVSAHDAPLADGNGNIEVDAADYVIWRKNLGNTGPGGGSLQWKQTVPEPASLLILMLGLGRAAVPRWRRAE